MNDRWKDTSWSVSYEIWESSGLPFKQLGVLKESLMGPGRALVSPPFRLGVGWGWGGWEGGSRERARKSVGFLRRQSNAGKYVASLCQQPLSAERGVEVRGSFLPWHSDRH